ncbi:hypothetical protein BH10BAC4_BH10BAC4_21040 [soil metagenome]
MQNAHNDARPFFSKLFSFSEEVIDLMCVSSSFLKVNKDETVITEATFNPNVYVIKKGLVRSYFIDEVSGNEINKTFRSEQEYFMQCEEPELKSSYQALEPCEFYVIHLDIAGDLKKNHASFQEFLYRTVSEDWRRKELLNKMLSLPTAKARYAMLEKKFPDWLQRVPQFHLASFLNMTPVHLSRVRKSH